MINKDTASSHRTTGLTQGPHESRLKKLRSPLNSISNAVKFVAVLFCCVVIPGLVRCSDESQINFIDECRTECSRHRDPFTCGKFRAVQWIHNVTSVNDFRYGSLRVIRLPAASEVSLLPPVPKFRMFDKYARFLNFVRSSAEDVLTRRALVYTMERNSEARSLSSGPVIMDGDEVDDIVNSELKREKRIFHKKKKKVLSVVLPLMILWKIFKLKLLLIPILIGVHFIKKILLIGALALSTLFSNLKYCKMPPPMPMVQPTYYNSWSSAAEAPVDVTSTGHEDEGWAHRVDLTGYATAPGAVQDPGILHSPYRGYYNALRQQQLLAQQPLMKSLT